MEDNEEYYECGAGWYPIIKKVVNYVNTHNSACKEDEKIEITQIKEKFGALEMYAHNKNDEYIRLVSEARDESLKTCEFCGSKEDIGQMCDGWITTLCHKCAEKLAKQQNRNRLWYSYNIKKKVELKGKEDNEKD